MKVSKIAMHNSNNNAQVSFNWLRMLQLNSDVTKDSNRLLTKYEDIVIGGVIRIDISFIDYQLFLFLDIIWQLEPQSTFKKKSCPRPQQSIHLKTSIRIRKSERRAFTLLLCSIRNNSQGEHLIQLKKNVKRINHKPIICVNDNGKLNNP
uniref:Uncharacterized protein n=1 Tax=Glossina austeni TaxID=7395 RepID=A0A1A9VY86_GLOAU